MTASVFVVVVVVVKTTTTNPETRMTASVLKQDPNWTRKQTKNISYLASHITFHCFSLINCCLSFCSMKMGLLPKICRLCVCVLINKRSFEPFMCLDLLFCGRQFVFWSFHSVFDLQLSLFDFVLSQLFKYFVWFCTQLTVQMYCACLQRYQLSFSSVSRWQSTHETTQPTTV